MKKYVGTISFIIITIIIISTFYISGTNADSKMPQFMIKQTAGEKQFEIEAKGNLYINSIMTYNEHRFTIGKNGTSYFKRGLFDHRFEDEKIEQLRKDYPGFMRRKDYASPNAFYENKELIGYATDESKDQPKLDLAVLNKKSGKINEFQLDVNGLDKEAWYLSVARVGIYGDEMKVVATTDFTVDEQYKEFIYLITINLKEKKIVGTKKILTEKGENKDQSLSLLFTNSTVQNGEHFVFTAVKELSERDEQGELSKVKETERKYYDLNMKTSELHEIKSVITEENMEIGVVKGDKLYAFKQKKDGLVIQPYNLDNHKELKAIKFDKIEGFQPGENMQVTTQAGKLLLYRGAMNIDYQMRNLPYAESVWPQIAIVDIDAGKLDYAGRVLPEDMNFKELMNSEISITEFSFK